MPIRSTTFAIGAIVVLLGPLECGAKRESNNEGEVKSDAMASRLVQMAVDGSGSLEQVFMSSAELEDVSELPPKKKGKVDSAESSLVTLLNGYKLTNGGQCPAKSLPGSFSVVDPSFTYGFGCNHPDVQCSCPSMFYDCHVNDVPMISHFGYCRIAMWVWITGSLVIAMFFGGLGYWIIHRRKGSQGPEGQPLLQPGPHMATQPGPPQMMPQFQAQDPGYGQPMQQGGWGAAAPQQQPGYYDQQQSGYDQGAQYYTGPPS